MFEKFVPKKGEPKLYDLKDEFSELLEFKPEDSNIQKWNKYRNYNIINEENLAYGIDCDVCERATKSYKFYYTFLKSANCMRQYKKICTDELKGCLITKNDKPLIPIENIFKIDFTYQRQYKYQLVILEKGVKEYYRGDTMTSFKNTFCFYESKFGTDKEIGEQIEKLAKNYHTIGNMIPVPTGFNMSRAGEYAKYDYWDLAMIQIKSWYDSNKINDKELIKFLNNNKLYLHACKNWLHHFPLWRDFVDENYLNNYVDEKYMPILFWENHSYETPELPTDKKSFLAYLNILNKCIEERNGLILNKK